MTLVTINDDREIAFTNSKNNKDYREVLKLFNEKGIAADIGTQLGIDKREYQ